MKFPHPQKIFSLFIIKLLLFPFVLGIGVSNFLIKWKVFDLQVISQRLKHATNILIFSITGGSISSEYRSSILIFYANIISLNSIFGVPLSGYYYSTLAMAQKMVRITWKCSDHVKMFGSERPANGTKQQQSNRLIIALFLYRLSKIARFWPYKA